MTKLGPVCFKKYLSECEYLLSSEKMRFYSKMSSEVAGASSLILTQGSRASSENQVTGTTKVHLSEVAKLAKCTKVHWDESTSE